MTRTDTATRTISASASRVYAAFVDPAALLEWLPPKGMTGRFTHFDPRPGGSYRLVLTYRDAENAPGKSTEDSDVLDVGFVALTPDVEVVQAVDFVSQDPAFAGTMTMTWRIVPVESGSRVEIRADDVPAGISADDHAAGLESSLANLAAYLER